MKIEISVLCSDSERENFEYNCNPDSLILDSLLKAVCEVVVESGKVPFYVMIHYLTFCRVFLANYDTCKGFYCVECDN